MRRLAIRLEYDGTDFSGWQVQAQGRTVQGVVEHALRQTTGQPSRVIGASRTDAGVHAEGQRAHFDTESDLPTGQFVHALNYWLPNDVAVLDCREVDKDFHAQYDAVSKLYRYRLLLSPTPRPLRDRLVVRRGDELNISAMRECAEALLGRRDFTSFASEHSEVKNKVRTVLRSHLLRSGDELHYLIEADGFLYNMVRIIVGTLIEVGRGKMTVDQSATALQARNRSAAGPTAPAKGLVLVSVCYAENGATP